MLEGLKWLGTICIILASVCRAFEFHSADMVLSIVGALSWSYCAIRMKDKALMTVNGFIAAILVYGLIK